MRQSGHVYFVSGTGELEEELQRRRDRCRRINSNHGYVAIENVQVQQVHGNNGFSFLSRLVLSGPYGHWQSDVGDGQLVELVDVVKRYLELPKQPIEVRVVLEQRARARKRTAAAAAPEQLDEVAAIKRRMLEGR